MSYFVSYFHNSYLYMYVSCSGSITSVGEERAFFCYRLLVTMWFVIGCVILLWHSLCLPCNYFTIKIAREIRTSFSVE